MAYALQIPCVTMHFFPETLENIKKVCGAIGIDFQIHDNATCCGLPYFEKGELKTAKTIGEYNLNVYGQDRLLCISPKCQSTFEFQYPKIFNNTVSHNASMQLSRQIMGLGEILNRLTQKVPLKITGSYFIVKECCSKSQLDYGKMMPDGLKWMESPMSSSCCGAGTSLPAFNQHLAIQLSSNLIEAFKESEADAMVFEDDICRKQVINAAESMNYQIKTYNIIDIFAAAL